MTRPAVRHLKRSNARIIVDAAEQRNQKLHKTWDSSSTKALRAAGGSNSTTPPAPARRPSSDPKDFPAFAHSLPQGHNAFTIGGFVACRRCARVTSGQRTTKLLTEVCRGDFPAKGDGPLRRLEKGELPLGVTRWPDEG